VGIKKRRARYRKRKAKATPLRVEKCTPLPICKLQQKNKLYLDVRAGNFVTIHCIWNNLRVEPPGAEQECNDGQLIRDPPLPAAPQAIRYESKGRNNVPFIT
jgi:hypothetical protein